MKLFLTAFSIFYVLPFLPSPGASKGTIEDEYTEYFGKNPIEFRYWDQIRRWYSNPNVTQERSIMQVRKFCRAAHQAAEVQGYMTDAHHIERGRGAVYVDRVYLRPRDLSFADANYATRRVDVLSYAINGVTKDTVEDEHWFKIEGKQGYMTEGRQPDCVYYLTLVNGTSMVFKLAEHVCGIHTDL